VTGNDQGPQIEALSAYKDHEFHYITAITKPQIETLLQLGEIQLELFDQVLAEVQANDGIRYVLRRNPVRAAEMQRVRKTNIAPWASRSRNSIAICRNTPEPL